MDRIVHALDAAMLRARVTAALKRLVATPDRPWRAEPSMTDGERSSLVRASREATRRAARRRSRD
jgi:TfoX/Sxy family transcriptional regulator of competence genes